APPAHRHTSRASRGGLIAAALVPLVAFAIALPIVLSSGGSTKPHTRSTAGTARATSHSPATKQSQSGTTGQSGAAASGSSGATPPTSAPQSSATAGSANASATGAAGGAVAPAATGGGAGSPTGAVETFYELAASHRYSQAWALADPTFRDQLAGYSSFAG